VSWSAWLSWNFCLQSYPNDPYLPNRALGENLRNPRCFFCDTTWGPPNLYEVHLTYASGLWYAVIRSASRDSMVKISRPVQHCLVSRWK
jgi:hypothetical protein